MNLSEFLLLFRFFEVVIGHNAFFAVKISLDKLFSSFGDDETESNMLLEFDNVQRKCSENVFHVEVSGGVLQELKDGLLSVTFSTTDLGMLEEGKDLPYLGLASLKHFVASRPDEVSSYIKLKLKNSHGNLRLSRFSRPVIIESSNYLP